MTDKEYLNTALAKMHSGQWFGWKKDYTGSERMSPTPHRGFNIVSPCQRPSCS